MQRGKIRLSKKRKRFLMGREWGKEVRTPLSLWVESGAKGRCI